MGDRRLPDGVPAAGGTLRGGRRRITAPILLRLDAILYRVPS
jgi:hypothetical protein